MEVETLRIANSAKDTAHEAKTIALEANNKVDSYMKVNTIQFDALMKESASTRKSIQDLYGKAWIVAGTFIVLLLGALGAVTAMILSKVG